MKFAIPLLLSLEKQKTQKLTKTLENNKAKGLTSANQGVQIHNIWHSSASSESIWTTAWVPSLPSYRPSPKNPATKNLPPLAMSDLLLPDTRRWNEHLLYALFDQVLADAICRLPISEEFTPRYLWTPSCSGRFTTNSVYFAILNNDFTGASLLSPSLFWKDIWKLQLTDRLCLFLWKIAWDILPMTSRLQSILPAYQLNASCLLCKTGPDSIRHLFFHCPFARVIWRLSPWPLDSVTLTSPNLCGWIQIILSLGSKLHISSSEHHRFQVFATVTCDLLWFHRN
jgi:ribonuclease HI